LCCIISRLPGYDPLHLALLLGPLLLLLMDVLLVCAANGCWSLCAALLQRVVDPSGVGKIKVIGQQQQNPMQRDTVRQLLPQADANWWAPGHVGWTIFPADTDTFEVGWWSSLVASCCCSAVSPSPPAPLSLWRLFFHALPGSAAFVCQ
jgi:hypothetical protein